MTKETSQITSCRTEGEDGRSGQKMEKRFFLDRVNAKSACAAISGENHPVSFPNPNKTESALLIEEFTATGAKRAFDPSVGKIFPVEGVRSSVHEGIMVPDRKPWNNKIRLEVTLP